MNMRVSKPAEQPYSYHIDKNTALLFYNFLRKKEIDII